MPERLEAICLQYPDVVRVEYIAAMHLLAPWRNVFVHRDYRFGLALTIRKILTGAKSFFNTEHGGADIEAALSRFELRQPPSLTDLSTLVSSAQRVVRSLDEHLLQLQNGRDYALALMHYLIRTSGDPQAFLEYTWQRGGTQSVGRVHASFLKNGGNHDDVHRANSPTVTSSEMHNLFAYGRKQASEIFGISRKPADA